MADTPQLSPIDLSSHPVYDRPKLAFQALLTGNWQAVGRGIYDPMSLTPKERQTLADRLGLAGTPFEFALNVSTNPVVLAGLVMSMFTHVPLASELAGFKGGAEKIAANNPVLRFLGPIREGTRGTSLGDTAQAIMTEGTSELKRVLTPWGKLLQKFLGEADTRTIPFADQTRLAVYQDGLWDPANPMVRVARGILQQGGREDLAAALDNPLPGFVKSLDPRLRALADAHQRELTGPVGFPWLYRPENQEAIKRTMWRKHGVRGLEKFEIQNITNYLPHVPLYATQAEEAAAHAEFARQWANKSFRTAVYKGAPQKRMADQVLHRYYNRMPAPELLRSIGAPETTVAAFDEAASILAQRKYGLAMKTAGEGGPTLLPKKEFYDLNYTRNWKEAFSELARTKAWSTPPEVPAHLRKYLAAESDVLRVPPDEAARTRFQTLLTEGRQSPTSLRMADPTATEDVDRLVRSAGYEAPRPDVPNFTGNPRPAFDQALSVLVRDKKFPEARALLDLYREQAPEGARVATDLMTFGTAQRETYGERLHRAIDEVRTQGPTGEHAATVMERTVIPMMMGALPERAGLANLGWNAGKQYLLGKLESPLVKRITPGPVRETLTNWLVKDPSSSWQGVGSAISSWMYTTTIGLPNPVPPAMNLLQSLNLIGLGERHLIGGYKDTFDQFFHYIEKRLGGLSREEAISAVNPAFARMNLELEPTAVQAISDAMETSLQQAQRVLGPNVRRMTDKAKSSLMSLFSGTETFNRLVAFNTGLRKGFAELPGTAAWDVRIGRKVTLPKDRMDPLVQDHVQGFAAKLVRDTQYGGGPLERPAGMLNWWAPLSQYTSFVSRQAALLGGPMLRNPGWLGRTMVGTGAIYEGAKAIGMNEPVGRGLLFGGLPEPTENMPFSPYLFVTPSLQVVGAVGQALATGESAPLRKAAPLLIPGGTGLARLLPMLPWAGKPVGEFLGRKYANYSRMLPDGRVPVFSASGSLVNYQTETQLLAKSLGLGDVSGPAETNLTQYLIRQRDVALQYKRDYLAAVERGDYTEAITVQDEYHKRFPGLGDLPIRPTDVEALHTRLEVSRVERLLQSMPPALREELMPIVAGAFGANAPNLLAMQQQALGPGRNTIRVRDAWREHPREYTQQRVSQGLHGVKLRDKIGLRGQVPIGRKPGTGGPWSSGRWYPEQQGPY